MSKLVKKMQMDALTHSFAGVRDMVLLSPTKVNSTYDYNFRKVLRDKKVKVMMVKNTIARKILGEAGINAGDVWNGTTLIAWGSDSIKGLSKAIDSTLKEIIKKNPKAIDTMKVKTAIADGQPCSLERAMVMPTRLEAIGDVLGMILGIGSSIAGSITAPFQQIASQIATLCEPKEETETPAEPGLEASTTDAPAAVPAAVDAPVAVAAAADAPAAVPAPDAPPAS